MISTFLVVAKLFVVMIMLRVRTSHSALVYFGDSNRPTKFKFYFVCVDKRKSELIELGCHHTDWDN